MKDGRGKIIQMQELMVNMPFSNILMRMEKMSLDFRRSAHDKIFQPDNKTEDFLFINNYQDDYFGRNS